MRKVIKATYLSKYPVDSGCRFVYDFTGPVPQGLLDQFSDKLEDAVVTSKTAESTTAVYIDRAHNTESAADIVASLIHNLNLPKYEVYESTNRPKSGFMIEVNSWTILCDSEYREYWFSDLEDIVYFIYYYEINKDWTVSIRQYEGNKLIKTYNHNEINQLLSFYKDEDDDESD